jgi:hypothetical protein
MIAQTTLVALVLVFAAAGTTFGAELFSPPMTPGDGNVLRCEITNVSENPGMVTIEIFGEEIPIPGDGALLDSAGPLFLASLNSRSLSFIDQVLLTPHICKFTVQGGKAGYRASACTAVNALAAAITCVAAE